jgi:hypothetical protein
MNVNYRPLARLFAEPIILKTNFGTLGRIITNLYMRVINACICALDKKPRKIKQY